MTEEPLPIIVNGTVDQLMQAAKTGDLRMYEDLVTSYLQALMFRMNPTPETTFTLTISETDKKFLLVLIKDS